MSWIVETILNNRNIIRSRAIDQLNIESDEYNDLITIENAINSLLEKGKISDKELEILDMTGNGDTVSMVASKEKGKRDKSLIKKYKNLCDRVAFYLGGYFTDEGYLNHMKLKYNLADDSIDALRLYINSKLKHRIKRKPITNDKNFTKEMQA